MCRRWIVVFAGLVVVAVFASGCASSRSAGRGGAAPPRRMIMDRREMLGVFGASAAGLTALGAGSAFAAQEKGHKGGHAGMAHQTARSEEHTSELQSQS